MADFTKGDRVVRFGKPGLGVGIIEDETESGGFVVRWTVDGEEWLGFHYKSHLRREAYGKRNAWRDDVKADLFVEPKEVRR